jgi:hypothetical protein
LVLVSDFEVVEAGKDHSKNEKDEIKRENDLLEHFDREIKCGI